MKTKTPNPAKAVPQIEEIEKLKAQIVEYEEKWKRSLADYINLEKRMNREKESFASLALVSIVIQFLEVLDDLQLVKNHLKDQALDMAVNKFVNILKNFGLTEIEALGKSFDPNTMECVETQPGEANKVLTVRKTGYLLNGNCLRPAGVIVGKSETKN